jgi:hypothetical protein
MNEPEQQMSDDSKSPSGNGKGALAGAQSLVVNEQTTRTITVRGLHVKWARHLELALDAVHESKSGDIGLMERNLVEGATEMLSLASEIRAKLRQ